MSTTYPDNPPPLPAVLTGTPHVRGRDGSTSYEVNFDTGECDCQHGAAWRWDNRRWVANQWCNHKLKATASLIDKMDAGADRDDLYDFYELQIGKRYNAFVAVSAFHKELRLGNIDAACYWATALTPHRGPHNVVSYMRNIVFEETRDLTLYRYLLALSTKGRSIPYRDMYRAVARFCRAPKKWELPWRLELFLDEMRAYKKLAAEYSYDVAKPVSDQIPIKDEKKLFRLLQRGFVEGDRVMVQQGLKGAVKIKSSDHGKLCIRIFNLLTDISDNPLGNAFEHDQDYCNRLHDLVLRRINNYGAPGYHELNALCDSLTGETGAHPRTTLPSTQHKLIVNNPRLYRIPLGTFKRVPLYANDNHTWGGKALMKRYRHELDPGAEQDNIDFRLCGAYMGVAWRLLAQRQKDTIDCKWGDVKWRGKGLPSWLWGHLDNMWY